MLSLTDLDPVAGGIAYEKTLRPIVRGLLFDDEPCGSRMRARQAKVGYEETDVPLARRRSFIVEPNVKLHICDLKPGAAVGGQLLRLGNLRKPQQAAIKGDALPFQGSRDADLDMVDTGNAKGHRKNRPRWRSLASMGGGC